MNSKKTLTLSIVIPVYNEQHHIKRCLDIIAAQTVRPDSVIVVDNNSTDNSVAIAKKYPFVRLVKESEQGIVFARNSGFNAVTTDLIGRIDADTILPHDWVQQVLDFYAVPSNADKCLTGGGFFYNIRTPHFNGWLLSQLAYRMNRQVSGHYILWGSNMVIPKKVWQEVSHDICIRDDIHEDVDLAIHVHRAGYDIVYEQDLRVGVQLKRVWSNRWQQKKHMSRWPRTFHVHGNKLWWMGSLGNVFLSVVGEPYIFVSEGLARLFKRPRLPL